MRRTDKYVPAEDDLPVLGRSRSARFLGRAVPVLLALSLAGISGYFLAMLLAPRTQTNDRVVAASTTSTPLAATALSSASLITASATLVAEATSLPDSTGLATATVGVQMLDPVAVTPTASSAPVEPTATTAPATATVQPTATTAPATATVQPTATTAPATATVQPSATLVPTIAATATVQPSATLVPTIAATATVTATPLLPAALLQEIAQIETGFQSGEIEATIEYGTNNRSSARVRFDLNTSQPRLDMLTTYASKAGTATIEQIVIGEQAWVRRGSEQWTATTATEGVWGQINQFLPRAARAATPQVATSGDNLEVRWYDSSSDADVILQIDPQTHVPRQLQRITRTNRTIMTVYYRGWNTPVEIAAPTIP